MFGLQNFSVRTLRSVAVSAALVVGGACAAQASTVVFEEDFSGAVGNLYGPGVIAGTKFEVTGGSIDIVNVSNYGCVAKPLGACIDLIGANGTGSVLSTSVINLIAGNSYSINFTDVLQGFVPWAGQTASYLISLGSHLFSAQSDQIVTPKAFTFTAAATELGAKLGFMTTSNIDYVHGPVLSDISVTETLGNVSDPVSPVPLPASLPLLAVGLGGLGLLRRRTSRDAS